MGRPKKSDSEKLVSVGLYVTPQHEAELKQIAESEDRERGYITRALYLRGLAAYRRDGRLLEENRREAVTPSEDFKATRAHIGRGAKKKPSDSNRKSGVRKR